ncbi:class I SAM-dependent methyltransferase [Thermus thermophilus]|uniref:class I SAM-dependent methyltransferase n=1 Tax=Thermus thermophilus TaxID=274 RepID=UPI001CC76BBF|nr:class I SAM-dependent methyltransferase [Thermus thermophilus]BDB12325.1 methyltransferase [Thermus thermophilus]
MVRKRLFARIYPWLSAQHEALVAERKRVLFQEALGRVRPGEVLEIGPGPGTNLAYLPPGVRYLALEPNPFFHPRLRARAGALGIDLTLLSGRAEAIPLPGESVDLVVGTLVLCSVANPEKAIEEVHRVLRPGGAYLFLEHVAAPRRTPLRFLQEAATPFFSLLGDGCHPNRETLSLVQARFSRVEAEAFFLPFPVVAPHVAGLAFKG